MDAITYLGANFNQSMLLKWIPHRFRDLIHELVLSGNWLGLCNINNRPDQEVEIDRVAERQCSNSRSYMKT